jgi:hypothetical protein
MEQFHFTHNIRPISSETDSVTKTRLEQIYLRNFPIFF